MTIKNEIERINGCLKKGFSLDAKSKALISAYNFYVDNKKEIQTSIKKMFETKRCIKIYTSENIKHDDKIVYRHEWQAVELENGFRVGDCQYDMFDMSLPYKFDWGNEKVAFICDYDKTARESNQLMSFIIKEEMKLDGLLNFKDLLNFKETANDFSDGTLHDAMEADMLAGRMNLI